MKREISIVNSGDKTPLSMSIVQFDGVHRHMHGNPQLLINMSGETTISLPEGDYSMKSNDIVIVNSRVYHRLYSKGLSTVISVIIDPIGFGLDAKEEQALSFHLNSMADPENPRINPIRFLVYSIIKYNTMENVNSVYTNRAIAYSFFAQLVNDFKTTNVANKSMGQLNTITQITNFIEAHFAQGITLNSLAEQFGFSVPYISRLFKQSLGKNFLDYYDEVRVNYSIEDLLAGKYSIEEIANKYGFENARNYVRAFKKIHDTYPSAYRKQEKSSESGTFDEDESLVRKQTLDFIIEALDEYNASTGNRKETARNTSFISGCDVLGKATSFVSPCNMILTCDGIEPLLIKENTREIEKTAKELGFKSFRIKHVLSNDFPYLFSRESGTRHFQLPVVERLINSILQLKLYPYLEFDYSNQRMGISEYEALVKEALDYIAKRFRYEKLHHWKFAFTCDDLTDTFLEVANDLAKYCRKICNIKIVSPSFSIKQLYQGGKYHAYKKLGFTPDFTCISLHEAGDDLLMNSHFVRDEIEKLESQGLWPENRVILVDSYFSAKELNLLYDTAFSSSFLAEEEIESSGKVYALTHAIYTAHQMWRLDNELFSGTKSFFERGIKKPNYNVLSLLSKLGSELLKKEENCLYTRKDNGVVLLFSNYTHYSDLYAKNQYYELSRYERYRCFPKGTEANYHIELVNIPSRRIEVKKTTLGKNSGSCFDVWMEMGSPEILSEEEFATLKGFSEMKFLRYSKEVSKGTANIEFTISPMDVCLIEITYLD